MQSQFNLEFNSDEFIEKVELQQSVDGVHFELMNEMKAISSTIHLRNYMLMGYVAENKKYFRAKIITSNKNIYSNIILLDNQSSQNKLFIFPNPTQQITRVKFSNSEKQNITLRLISLNGKELQEIESNNDYILLNTSQYQNGTYILQLFKENNLKATEKIIINN